MTYENDRNDAAREIVIKRAEACVRRLNQPPTDSVCASHEPIAEGVALSLEMQIPSYRKYVEQESSNNVLTFGKLRVSGAAAINSFMRFAMVAGVIYLILKMHGVAP